MPIKLPRWTYCYSTRDSKLGDFLRDYCASERRILYVGGAGFDPRATDVARLLATSSPVIVDGILVKEERPRPPAELSTDAESNLATLQTLLRVIGVVEVDIFSADGNTVVGGRTAVRKFSERSFASYSDVVVDFSALSIGVSFPLAKYFLALADDSKGKLNLHFMVASSPQHDDQITALAGDVVTSVHGFHGDAQLEGVEPAKLWLPQLKFGQQATLQRLHESLSPHDTCPVLPFPAENPRTGDLLLEAYSENLKSWDVDPRNVIYASESDPLDIYRTISRLCEERARVFAAQGSLVILSPIGSKVVGIGALMAALEKDLPIRYLEAENYEISGREKAATLETHIVHIWVVGGPA